MKLSKPYLFLLTLIIILVFIIGVRYGQQVERVNKTINYLLSITPSKSPTPTPTWTIIQYKTKTGIKINYPSFLKIEEINKGGEILIK
ncbi:MAG: hypothetical protein KatS3mg092_0455 [Patescibacteria group bacterium]|nr:MAG: hypothetical protein KatS3mg092_0455 [Patescibacteria group bacterium]